MDKFKLFYKEYLRDKVREGLKLAFEAFYKTLWDFIKEDVLKAMYDSLKAIETIVNSKKGQDKKEEIVDLIMTKVKLPIVLKPFKNKSNCLLFLNSIQYPFFARVLYHKTY